MSRYTISPSTSKASSSGSSMFSVYYGFYNATDSWSHFSRASLPGSSSSHAAQCRCLDSTCIARRRRATAPVKGKGRPLPSPPLSASPVRKRTLPPLPEATTVPVRSRLPSVTTRRRLPTLPKVTMCGTPPEPEPESLGPAQSLDVELSSIDWDVVMFEMMHRDEDSDDSEDLYI